MSAQHYLDFDIEIGMGDGGQSYPVAVLASPGGQARGTLQSFSERELESALKDLEIALLRSSSGPRRTVLSPREQAVQHFGLRLFNALFGGDLRSCYDVARRMADEQGRGLRVKLRIRPPELAALPWEFLYDTRRGDYLCLDDVSLVRYLELAQPVAPLTTSAPLRVLGMVASPNDQERLNVEREQARVTDALAPLEQSGLVQLHWVAGQTVKDLQKALKRGPWHIFHFVGHGGFDENPDVDEGFLAFCDADGDTFRLYATQLAMLVRDHRPLRLVLLNACDGARGGQDDIFSSTAAILARNGPPAVLAMQHSITDRAAAEFATVFYESIAASLPVDAAVTEARKAMRLLNHTSVEWGTPVLYLRAADGVLFDVSVQTEAAKEQLRQAEQERIEHAEREQGERERVERERDELSELTTRLAKLNVNVDYEQVIKIGEQIVQLDSNPAVRSTLAKAYLNCGVDYHNKGEHDNAITDYTRAIDLSPQEASYYCNRGMSYHRKRDYEHGIGDYTCAIALSPQTALYYQQRGVSYHFKGDYDRALADHTRAIELSPQTAAYYYSRGGSYYMKGDYDRALADGTRAIELDPINRDYYYIRGLTYKAQSNTSAARQDFQRALALGYTDAQKELDKLTGFFGRLFS